MAILQYLGSGSITVSPASPAVVYSSVTGNFHEVWTTNKNWAGAKTNAESRKPGTAAEDLVAYFSFNPVFACRRIKASSKKSPLTQMLSSKAASKTHRKLQPENSIFTVRI